MAKREVELKLNVDSSGSVRNVKDVKTEMQKMAKARDEATDPKKIKQLNAAIGDLKKEQAALTSATEDTAQAQANAKMEHKTRNGKGNTRRANREKGKGRQTDRQTRNYSATSTRRTESVPAYARACVRASETKRLPGWRAQR